MTASPRPDHIRKPIALPRSSTRLQRPLVFCKVLTKLSGGPFNVAFQGKIYPPGAVLPPEEIPDGGLVLECAGAVGRGERGKLREMLWILWKLDGEEWRELARSQSSTWEWIEVLKPAAMQAMSSNPQLVEVGRESRRLTDEMLNRIEERLESQGRGVRINVLTSLYDQIAGKLAEIA